MQLRDLLVMCVVSCFRVGGAARDREDGSGAAAHKDVPERRSRRRDGTVFPLVE